MADASADRIAGLLAAKSTDADLQARIDEMRRKAADGTLLGESYGREDLLRSIEEARRHPDRRFND